MKSKAYLIVVLYLFFAVSGSLYSIGEKTIQMKGDEIRKIVDYNAGITEAGLVRPSPVLILSSTPDSLAAAPADLILSFDEGRPAVFGDACGHYRVSTSSLVTAVDTHHARSGYGAALFPGSGFKPGKTAGPLVIEAGSGGALFAQKNRINDFSMEFWLYPLNMENGEQILLWDAALSVNNILNYDSQRIMCVSSKNRLRWSFLNFFASPDNTRNINIQFDGVSAVVPKTWSHHLIRFDSATGMLEYLVNGRTESIEYATSTGHEGGEVYTPSAGDDGSFVLGGSFSGIMDEFRIHGGNVPGTAMRKYPLRGGRIETKAIDLGHGSSGLLKLEASGGTTSIVNARINSEYRRNGRFRFSDDSEMQFFLRCSDNPYRWENPWQPVTPGDDLAGTIHGRYVQLAVDFYPSADGESSPYLEELSITYLPDDPPLPPTQLTAVAVDGGVQLHWKNSPGQNAGGYMVYYGTESGNYFGEDSLQGISPIDVGKQNSVFITGLKNGTLYYFRVAAYSRPDINGSILQTGEFSREVRARPWVEPLNAASPVHP